jgi:hypothetical protein
VHINILLRLIRNAYLEPKDLGSELIRHLR